MSAPWPQFCAALLSNPQLREADPELYARVEAIVREQAAAGAQGAGGATAPPAGAAGPPPGMAPQLVPPGVAGPPSAPPGLPPPPGIPVAGDQAARAASGNAAASRPGNAADGGAAVPFTETSSAGSSKFINLPPAEGNGPAAAPAKAPDATPQPQPAPPGPATRTGKEAGPVGRAAPVGAGNGAEAPPLTAGAAAASVGGKASFADKHLNTHSLSMGRLLRGPSGN